MVPCRLYLVLPEGLEPRAFAADLAAVLDAGGGDLACVELRLAEDADAAAWREAVTVLGPLVQGRDIAFVLYGQPRLAADLGCDGAHIPSDGDVSQAEARRAVGEGMILGVSCGTSRHAAMEAAEAGADFVGFDPDPEIVGWWAGLMEIPCVAFALGAAGGAEDAAGDPAALVAAGADFLAVRDAVWEHPEGPLAGLAAVTPLLSR